DREAETVHERGIDPERGDGNEVRSVVHCCQDHEKIGLEQVAHDSQYVIKVFVHEWRGQPISCSGCYKAARGCDAKMREGDETTCRSRRATGRTHPAPTVNCRSDRSTASAADGVL